MKVTKETLSRITEELREAFEAIGIHPLEVWKQRDRYANQTLWQIWKWIHNQRIWTDDHPSFAEAGRRLAYDENHELYPDDTNDRTMTTALRAAFFKIVDGYAMAKAA